MPDRIYKRALFFNVFSLLIICTLAVISIPVHAQSGVDISLHYAEGLASGSGTTYQVNAYFSVYDINGVPVVNLEKKDVSFTEDGKKVDILSLERASVDPASLIILLDNSETMAGGNLDISRSALGAFAGQMGGNEQIAFYSFNDTPEQKFDLDTPRQDIQGLIGQIEAAPGSGTCLYDAIHTAVNKAGSFKPGNRAVIVVTNGEDKKVDGTPCSTHTAEETILLASNGATRVPLFVIGIGNKIDPKMLQELADSTGGRYYFASNNQYLDSLFSKLAKEWKGKYVLRYGSSAQPGNHKLSAVFTYKGATKKDERDFLIQDKNITLAITNLVQGEEVSGKKTITVDLQGSNQVGGVQIFIDETSIGTVSTLPYSLEWDFNNSPSGPRTITVAALGSDGSELAKTSLAVIVTAPRAEVIPTVFIPTATVIPVTETSSTPLFIAAGVLFAVIGVLIVAAVVVFFLVRKSRLSNKNQVKTSLAMNPEAVNPKPPDVQKGHTRGTLATLEVLFSDDPEMNGRVLDLTKPVIRIGRSPECDLVFPNDTPISRIHALIELRGEDFYLTEAVSPEVDSSLNKPKFGTFINEQPVQGATGLRRGDVIRLGPRARFRFEPLESPKEPIEETIDLSLPEGQKETVILPGDEHELKTDILPQGQGDPDRTVLSESQSDDPGKKVDGLSSEGESRPGPAGDEDSTVLYDEIPAAVKQETGQPQWELPAPSSTPEGPAEGSLEPPPETSPDNQDVFEEENRAENMDEGKTLDDLAVPSINEDLEKTLDDIKPFPDSDKTLDDLVLGESDKTLDDFHPDDKQ